MLKLRAARVSGPRVRSQIAQEGRSTSTCMPRPGRHDRRMFPSVTGIAGDRRRCHWTRRRSPDVGLEGHTGAFPLCPGPGTRSSAPSIARGQHRTPAERAAGHIQHQRLSALLDRLQVWAAIPSKLGCVPRGRRRAGMSGSRVTGKCSQLWSSSAQLWSKPPKCWRSLRQSANFEFRYRWSMADSNRRPLACQAKMTDLGWVFLTSGRPRSVPQRPILYRTNQCQEPVPHTSRGCFACVGSNRRSCSFAS
jgi:hypothetical protein